MTLRVDRVQGDPYAAPSRVTVVVPTALGAFTASRAARVAACDFLLRRFAEGLPRGLSVLLPGPEITERSAVVLHTSGDVEVRLRVALPARGRRVRGREAEGLLCRDLVAVAERMAVDPDDPALRAHVASVVRQRALRAQLSDRGLVAFVGDGSVLPRASGVDPAPLRGAVPFVSPQALRVTLEAPGGPVVGMGVPQGVVLICGGGFHGKSTVLQALQGGHLDRVPGDGREVVVSHPDTVKIRAEDGRWVRDIDISAFLSDLPGGRETTAFHTADASGSTSQAASLVEAIEAGARVVLLDEDTSATNLLVRDQRMRALVPREREPITPLVERVRQLASAGVSTVMVVGGVGDWLAVADVVLVMADFEASEETARAREVAGPTPEAPGPWVPPTPRAVAPGEAPFKIRARDARAVRFGDAEIDLTGVEHVRDGPHAQSLGQAVRFIHANLADGVRTVAQVLDALDAILDDEGADALSPYEAPPGDLVRPRRHEVAAALHRLRPADQSSSSSSRKAHRN